MPVVVIFHKIDAFTHDSFHKYNDGFAVASELFCFIKGIDELFHVVAVGSEHSPAESLPFSFKVALVEDLVDRAVDLFIVKVDSSDEVVDTFSSGVHSGFPYLAFFQFTVAVECKDQMWVFVEFFPEGHSNAER